MKSAEAELKVRYVWADISPRDAALRPGEFASARPSLPSERRHAGALKGMVCNTFLLRGCGYVMPLIVTMNQRQPSLLKRMTMERDLRRRVAAKTPEVVDPFSTSVFATVLALVPDAVTDLRWIRQNRKCEACTCIFRDGGPLDNGSPQAAFSETQCAERQAAREIRHDR